MVQLKNKNLVNICLLVLGGVVIVYLVIHFMNQNKAKQQESFNVYPDEPAPFPMAFDVDDKTKFPDMTTDRQMYEEPNLGPVEEDKAASPKALDNQQQMDCFPKNELKPEDLLPSDENSEWAQSNPAQNNAELGAQNFLTAGYHVGINTVGQSLRNANYQLRSEPANPQIKVSPWMQSTIEPDTNRQSLEIGSCPTN